MNTNAFHKLWESYCKKAIRTKRTIETGMDYYYREDHFFYEPYLGTPAKCSAVFLYLGLSYKTSYLQKVLSLGSFSDYAAEYEFLPSDSKSSWNDDFAGEKKQWAAELTKAINGFGERYSKNPVLFNVKAINDLQNLYPSRDKEFRKKYFADYVLRAADTADLARVILCIGGDIRLYLKELGYKPTFTVVNGVEKSGKFKLDNWPLTSGTFSRVKVENQPACRTYIGYTIPAPDGGEPYKILLTYARMTQLPPAARFRDVELELLNNHF